MMYATRLTFIAAYWSKLPKKAREVRYSSVAVVSDVVAASRSGRTARPSSGKTLMHTAGLYC